MGAALTSVSYPPMATTPEELLVDVQQYIDSLERVPSLWEHGVVLTQGPVWTLIHNSRCKRYIFARIRNATSDLYTPQGKVPFLNLSHGMDVIRDHYTPDGIR